MRGHTPFPAGDPRHYTMKARATLDELIELLREDVDKIESPKAQALFETSAEVLSGLRAAFEHYEQGAEEGLREPPAARGQ